MPAKKVITNEETTTKVEKKKFNNNDYIECVSITPGELFVEGIRTKDLYTFVDADDIQEIRYDDLVAAVRSKSKIIFNPNIIIKDEDFLSEFPSVEEAYCGLYSTADLKNILKMSASQIEAKLPSLPTGAQNALKTIVVTMVENGSFDSVQKIKVLDAFFGTDILFRLTNK